MRPDVAGQALGTAALAALVFALIEGGKGGFGAAPALVGIAVAIGAFAGFVAVERRLSTAASKEDHRAVARTAERCPSAAAEVPAASAPVLAGVGADAAGTGSAAEMGGDGGEAGRGGPRPLLDLSWFRRREFCGANAGAGLMNLGTLGGLFALGLYLQQGEGLSPLEAGFALVPLAAPLAILTPFTGRLVGRIGPRLPAGIGLVMSGLGYLGTALVGSTSIDSPAGWACLALAGAGIGVAVPGLVAGATEALGPDRAGIASAVNNTSRQVGGAIGVALIGGLSTIAASLAFSAASLLLGGLLALALMGRGELVAHSGRGEKLGL